MPKVDAVFGYYDQQRPMTETKPTPTPTPETTDEELPLQSRLQEAEAAAKIGHIYNPLSAGDAAIYRGAGKYISGDYEGAIKDFKNAKELGTVKFSPEAIDLQIQNMQVERSELARRGMLKPVIANASE